MWISGNLLYSVVSLVRGVACYIGAWSEYRGWRVDLWQSAVAGSLSGRGRGLLDRGVVRV